MDLVAAVGKALVQGTQKNNMMELEEVQALLAGVPGLATVTSLTALGGGLTNINYKLTTTGGQYVLRVGHPASELLQISRSNERYNTAMANAAGVGPAVIEGITHENILLISWIEATTLHPHDLKTRPDTLPRIAAALRQLHQGPKFQGDFYFPVIRQKYRSIVTKHGYYIPEHYPELEPLVCTLEDALAENPEPWVPCNNDLLAENFMDDCNKIWIIDYEYGGMNEASFDIGNLASESGLSDEQLARLCDAYWQEHLPQKIARAKAWSMIARYGWIMWASIQEAISTIDFDYRDWGKLKWDSVYPELTGKAYTSVLQNLKNYTA